MTDLKFKDFVAGKQQRLDYATTLRGEPINIMLRMNRTHYGAYRVMITWHRSNRAGSGHICENVFPTIDRARNVFAFYSGVLSNSRVFQKFLAHTVWEDKP